MIKAEIVADSVNEFGNRITTMVVTFPRFILAELNTHRMFSRNSASSRAIPFEKMLKSVQENPFIPIAWQKDHKGMQGTEYLTGTLTEYNWLKARDKAVEQAKILHGLDVTKQLCNRLLEPFMWHTVIITATEWENFFALRCPKYTLENGQEYRSRKEAIKSALPTPFEDDTLGWLQLNKGQAEIHMMALAEAMWDAYNESTPKTLKAGEWHIPFGDRIELRKLANLIPHYQNTDGEIETNPELEEAKVKVATARCARVSYTMVGEEDKPANYENDIKLHDRLAQSGHWSPFEHIAQAMNKLQVTSSSYNQDDGPNGTLGWSGNLRGFIQYRKTFANENITKE